MADRFDREAAEICVAMGTTMGRTMVATALRQASKDSAREMQRRCAEAVKAAPAPGMGNHAFTQGWLLARSAGIAAIEALDLSEAANA